MSNEGCHSSITSSTGNNSNVKKGNKNIKRKKHSFFFIFIAIF